MDKKQTQPFELCTIKLFPQTTFIYIKQPTSTLQAPQQKEEEPQLLIFTLKVIEWFIALQMQ